MVLKIKNGNLGEILTAWTNFLFSYFLLTPGFKPFTEIKLHAVLYLTAS